MDAPTDEKLLQDYLEGDPGGFELLVHRHAKELHQFTLRFTGNSAAAEDVVQETFLQVHCSADKFDPARRFKPWLFTIAANKARDYLRRRERKREVSFEASVNGMGETDRRFLDLLSGDDAPPIDDVLLEEQRRLVRSVVEAIPERLCEILILAYYHRFTYREIGEIVGIPLGTVKSRLHAAVACFGQRYKEECRTAKEE